MGAAAVDTIVKVPHLPKADEIVYPLSIEQYPGGSTANIAVDQNLLIMEYMKKIAEKHGLVCLLHEKPYAGVNGSGKHNNWSITANGKNLLDPGKTPAENVQFLLILAAVLKAVDDYQELLRVSVAHAGNDHRLGANEAPPAIISVFIGEELNTIVDSIIDGTAYKGKKKTMMDLGIPTVPVFRKDTTDRNRTSPWHLRVTNSSSVCPDPPRTSHFPTPFSTRPWPNPSVSLQTLLRRPTTRTPPLQR